MTTTFQLQIEAEGYAFVRQLPHVGWIGVMKQCYTTGLFVGLTLTSYERRYCYEKHMDAVDAARTWDGIGDPPGPWVKAKGLDGERLGPGAL